VNRDDYLAFLADFGLSEEQVLPMGDLKKTPVEVVALLIKALGDRNIKGEEREQIETLAQGMAGAWNVNKLIEKLVRTLTDDFARANIRLPSTAFPGVFPTNTFNAQSVQRANGFLVLLDTGCFELIEAAVGVLLSKWEQEKKVEVLSSFIQTYCEHQTLPELHLLKPPGLGGPGEADASMLGLMYPLVTSTEEFVIAHEYGHVVNGHLDSANHRNLNVSLPTKTGKTQQETPHETEPVVELINKSFEQEFEADLWATDSLLSRGRAKAADEYFMAIICGGPIICLGIALLIEEWIKRHQTPSDTHPPASDRIYMIQSLYEIRELTENGYLGRRFLELVGDCAIKIFGEPVSVPMFSPELNKTLEQALDKVGVIYTKPEWMTAFR
jgi:hypothetical protein